MPLFSARAVAFFAAVVSGMAPLVAVAPLAAQEQPLQYELMINGEKFTVEAEKLQTFTSQEDPQTKYTIVLRLAPVQRRLLNSVVLEHDVDLELADDEHSDIRTVEFRLGLDLQLSVIDYGRPLTEELRDSVMRTLVNGTRSVAEAQHQTKVSEGKPRTRKLKDVEVREVILKYADRKDQSWEARVALLSHEKFCVSCVSEHRLEANETLAPLIEQVLKSIQPRSRRNAR